MTANGRRDESRFDGVLGLGQAIGLPSVRTLSEEYRDVPEPVDSEREPRPPAPGVLQRIVVRFGRILRAGRPR